MRERAIPSMSSHELVWNTTEHQAFGRVPAPAIVPSTHEMFITRVFELSRLELVERRRALVSREILGVFGCCLYWERLAGLDCSAVQSTRTSSGVLPRCRFHLLRWPSIPIVTHHAVLKSEERSALPSKRGVLTNVFIFTQQSHSLTKCLLPTSPSPLPSNLSQTARFPLTLHAQTWCVMFLIETPAVTMAGVSSTHHRQVTCPVDDFVMFEKRPTPLSWQTHTLTLVCEIAQRETTERRCPQAGMDP